MFPLIPALGAAAPLVGAGLDYFGQQQTNAQNWEQFVSNQMYNMNKDAQDKQYNTYMSNTAVQRRMQDLTKAGLNPMLAATDGASSPTANSSNPGVGNPMQNPAAGLQKGISNAMDAMRVHNETKAVQNTGTLQQAQAAAAGAAAIRDTTTANLTEKQRQLLDIGTGAAKARAKKSEAQDTIDESFIDIQKTMDLLEQGSRTGANSTQILSDVLGAFGKGKQYPKGPRPPGRWTPARIGDNVLLKEVP